MSTCLGCSLPLHVEVEHSDDEDDQMDTGASSSMAKESKTVPDDVQLPCGDHYHWQCLLDSYTIETCPNCNTSLISANGQQQELRVNLHNEGGMQHNLDILPLLREEQYLKAYPEERKSRAFLEFCRENDLNAIIQMIADGDDDEDEDEMDDDSVQDVRQKPMAEILVYQDPLANMQSGLMAAVEKGHRDLAWLLLLVASDLDFKEFPVQVFQEAEAMGIMREERIGAIDIRSLKDGDGKSAQDIASESGNPLWSHDGWIGTGRLSI